MLVKSPFWALLIDAVYLYKESVMNINALRKAFMEKYPFAIVLLFFIMLFPVSAFAHPPGYMGGSMMDEEDREKMMEERGYPYGPGYGWMGNMMGGGYGSMMGGGYGPMMGAFYGLDLSKEQRDKIRDIQRSMRKKNLGLMEKMMDRTDKLQELYDSEKLDPEKIGKAYDEYFKVKREMILQHVEARNKMYEVLNKEQREKFKSSDIHGHMGGMMMH